ncbi:hypothetical protein, unlikely [Trypanosoma brucei gambiense DAL972]|uniref:Uncharacterized protein n=1 Tax=Trypanosoma brucei gambiense (strain MHOM/CI/86/DAL972) TaxID=679716 RepID=D0AAI6_TRYB9|nr:hypothetical protein, unlikely [Trypanosoma brucei gambiense DAL972]CBH18687.1 hypothetical protein, unlikely [Trypanosoma brucei gambiense DAL972]|eukprot:XP_011780951.1 hypothetical protein, unlikely [Trypanosoma brucei gambiense DAL972]
MKICSQPFTKIKPADCPWHQQGCQKMEYLYTTNNKFHDSPCPSLIQKQRTGRSRGINVRCASISFDHSQRGKKVSNVMRIVITSTYNTKQPGRVTNMKQCNEEKFTEIDLPRYARGCGPYSGKIKQR